MAHLYYSIIMFIIINESRLEETSDAENDPLAKTSPAGPAHSKAMNMYVCIYIYIYTHV